MTELRKGENTVSCHIWMVYHACESILGAEPAGNYSHVMCVLHDSWLCRNTERLWAAREKSLLSVVLERFCKVNDFPGKKSSSVSMWVLGGAEEVGENLTEVVR